MKLHQGETIEKVIRRDGQSISDVARILGINRRSLYNWFTHKVLKDEIIYKVGHAIKHDFSVEFPEKFKTDDFVFNLSHTLFKPGQSIKDEPMLVDGESINWRDKYIALLEEHSKLLTKYHRNDITA